MEPELYAMGPPGVTFHAARVYVAQPALGSPAEAEAFVQAIFGALDVAVRDVVTMQPDQLIAGRVETGREIVRLKRIECPTSLSIARVDEATTRRALVELDGPDIDGIVQVGTDLVMSRLADEAERWLGKPVTAINAAMPWHALRCRGIDDWVRGFGALLRDH